VRDLGPAVYDDGETGRSLAVRLAADRRTLRILREDGRPLADWPGRAVRVVDGPAPVGAVRLGLDAAGRVALVVADPRVRAAVEAAFPGARRRARGPARTSLLLWSAAAAASVALLAVVLLPALAGTIARLIPEEAERRLGARTEDALVRVVGRGEDARCGAPAGLAALDQMVRRVAPDLADGLVVGVVRADMVNAVALPGGRVLFTSGLIEAAGGPDEVAAVLAHEVGHVVLGHAGEKMVRTALLSAAATLFFGDLVFGVGGAVATSLVSGAYSRDAEREADAFAAEALRAAGIDAGAMARFLDRLREREGDVPGALALLSTHPRLAERVDALRDARPPGPTSPALTPASWDALRRVCG
jgi:Zn-dependent protease with chaperone function